MRAAAFLAGAQVDPFAADLHAFITLVPFPVCDGGNRTDVGAALIRHLQSLLAKHLVDKCDGNGSFADRRRDALDIAAPHIADRKDAASTGFE